MSPYFLTFSWFQPINPSPYSTYLKYYLNVPSSLYCYCYCIQSSPQHLSTILHYSSISLPYCQNKYQYTKLSIAHLYPKSLDEWFSVVWCKRYIRINLRYFSKCFCLLTPPLYSYILTQSHTDNLLDDGCLRVLWFLDEVQLSQSRNRASMIWFLSLAWFSTPPRLIFHYFWYLLQLCHYI